MDAKLKLVQQINRSYVAYHTMPFHFTSTHCGPLRQYDFICDKILFISTDFCGICGDYKDIWLTKGILKKVICKCD
jgi:hypothetical protein